MGQENKRINIFPFTMSFFKDAGYFENYIRETLPDILTVEHTQLRKPDLMVFAYQGDHSLWGYAEIEGWKDPSETEAAVGIEWEGENLEGSTRLNRAHLKSSKNMFPMYSCLDLVSIQVVSFTLPRFPWTSSTSC